MEIAIACNDKPLGSRIHNGIRCCIGLNAILSLLSMLLHFLHSYFDTESVTPYDTETRFVAFIINLLSFSLRRSLEHIKNDSDRLLI